MAAHDLENGGEFSARFWSAAVLCRFACLASRWKSAGGLAHSKTLARHSGPLPKRNDSPACENLELLPVSGDIFPT